MHQGWIKLHRKIQDHWIYQEKRKFSRYEAWLDLIMLASHKDTKFVLGNELIELSKGSFVTSELKLMDRWGWGKGKVRTFLKLLEDDSMIVKKTDRKKTTINICNYSVYHDGQTENRPPTDHERTASGPPIVHNQECKELKECKEDIAVAAGENSHFKEAVKNKYLFRRGRGLETSAIDDAAIDELIKEKIPLQTILEGIDKSFDEYKSKHKRDQINSLNYCLNIIYDLHVSKTQRKGGSNRARNSASDERSFDKSEYFSL